MERTIPWPGTGVPTRAVLIPKQGKDEAEVNLKSLFGVSTTEDIDDGKAQLREDQSASKFNSARDSLLSSLVQLGTLRKIWTPANSDALPVRAPSQTARRSVKATT